MDDVIPLVVELNDALNLVVSVSFLRDGASVTLVPRMEFGKRLIFIVQPLDNHTGDIPGIVIRYIGAPARPDSLGSIDQTHRDDGNIVLWLNKLPIILDVVKRVIIGLREDEPRYFVEVSEDVSCTGVILSTLISGTKLAVGHEEINVVGPDETLSHVDDGHCEGHLAVMVG